MCVPCSSAMTCAATRGTTGPAGHGPVTLGMMGFFDPWRPVRSGPSHVAPVGRAVSTCHGPTLRVERPRRWRGSNGRLPTDRRCSGSKLRLPPLPRPLDPCQAWGTDPSDGKRGLSGLRLPELGADLIAALAALDVDELTHGDVVQTAKGTRKGDVELCSREESLKRPSRNGPRHGVFL